MDPIDDFDFKPITEGLGFHRKRVELKDEVEKAKVTQDVFSKVVPPKPKTEGLSLKAPLPKKETHFPIQGSTASSAIVKPPTRDIIDQVARSFKKPHDTFIEDVEVISVKTPTFIQSTKLSTQTQTPLMKGPLPWMAGPFFIDAMLVIALSLSCLLITLLVTQADLMGLITSRQNDIEFWFTMPAIVLGMMFIYMTLTRLFFGASFGELVFDLQLGTDDERHAAHYGFQVAFRTLLAMISGIVVLPLVSLITQKDYLGSATGLRLYIKRR